jgi:hypothetical protein
MNEAPLGLEVNGVYHSRNIDIKESISMPKCVSDHPILIGEIKLAISRSPETKFVMRLNKATAHANRILIETIAARA